MAHLSDILSSLTEALPFDSLVDILLGVNDGFFP